MIRVRSRRRSCGTRRTPTWPAGSDVETAKTPCRDFRGGRAPSGCATSTSASSRADAPTRAARTARRHDGRGMKVALRDDDTSYFTAPADLERVYGDVWQRVPVCLATVPFSVGYRRAGIPESAWNSGHPFPLDRNAALVDWLRAQIAERRVTI